MLAYTRRTSDKMLTSETSRLVSIPLDIMKPWYRRGVDKSTPKERRTLRWSLVADPTSFLPNPINPVIWCLHQSPMFLDLKMSSDQAICSVHNQRLSKCSPLWIPMLPEEWRKILVKHQCSMTQPSKTIKSQHKGRRPSKVATAALVWVTLFPTLTLIWVKIWWPPKIPINLKFFLKLLKKVGSHGKQSHKRLGSNQRAKD